jgi:hypothetical protein
MPSSSDHPRGYQPQVVLPLFQPGLWKQTPSLRSILKTPMATAYIALHIYQLDP